MKEEFMKDLDRIKEKHHPNHWDEDYDVEEFALQMEEQEFENLTTKEYINQQNQIKMKKVSNLTKKLLKPLLTKIFKENNNETLATWIRVRHIDRVD